jgi:MoxR-like ATPase
MSESIMNIKNRSAEAQLYYQEGMKQLDYLAIGEIRAKEMLLTAALIGQNALLVGEPGGGKSMLSGNFYRIFKDISKENVTQIPADPELSTKQLVGGSMSSKKVTAVEGSNPVVEEIRVDIDALVDEQTQIIWADEINRINPLAFNQLLSAYENGTLATTAGSVAIKGLVMAISTMNPSESAQATFPITAAAASRHAMGTILGFNNPEDRKSIVSGIIKSGWKATPEQMRSFISVQELAAIREWSDVIAIPDDIGDRLVELSINANDILRDYNINESDGRMATQVRQIARGLATVRGGQAVDANAANDAVRSMATARIGALKKLKSVKIDEITQEIINR